MKTDLGMRDLDLDGEKDVDLNPDLFFRMPKNFSMYTHLVDHTSAYTSVDSIQRLLLLLRFFRASERASEQANKYERVSDTHLLIFTRN